MVKSVADNDVWGKVQLARHSDRPLFLDYVDALFTEFDPLAGDRVFGEDQAIVGGTARFLDKPVMVIGQHRGRTTRERLARNFGMASPEGYRKVIRLAQLAARFKMPILTFIDTQGAYPGVGAEERGQAEAIARSIYTFCALKTPVIATVIGEGGSGGALAIGVADRINMLQNSIYSVISPEGCASILFKTAQKAADAACALKLDANSLLGLGVIDEIIDEGAGAHLDASVAFDNLQETLNRQLNALRDMDENTRKAARLEKILAWEPTVAV